MPRGCGRSTRNPSAANPAAMLSKSSESRDDDGSSTSDCPISAVSPSRMTSIDTSLLTSVYGCAITSWGPAASAGNVATLPVVIDTTGSNVVGAVDAFKGLFVAELRNLLQQPVMAALPLAG